MSPATKEAARTGTMRRLLPALLVAAAVIAVMLKLGTGSLLRPPAAPMQQVSFERVVLHDGTIEATVRNGGPDDLTIAQVLIDEAYWIFTQDPPGTLGRLDSAVLRLDYPWVAGEPIGITVIDNVGTTFSHEIGVAAETPGVGGQTVAGYVLLGTYAGLIPVLLGLLFLPAMRRLPAAGMRFLLGVTAGMLVFLVLDGFEEALEIAADTAPAFQGTALVLGVAAVSLLILQTLGRWVRTRRGVVTGLAVAYLVAIGIGLHNFGEGLAIGAAQAVGEIALSAFLVAGFAVHNLTEGIGIVAPTIKEQRTPGIGHLLALGAIAGVPTIFGTLAGGFAYSPVAAVVLFAVGIGAIVQVVIELAKLAGRERSAPSWMWGAASGFAVMYGTGLLIKS